MDICVDPPMPPIRHCRRQKAESGLKGAGLGLKGAGLGADEDNPKLAKTVSTLSELVAELHKVFDHDEVDTDHVSQLMLSYKSNPTEWRKYAKFDRYRYTRNLVDAGNGKFNLMVLCWGEGHASAIHDHADAHCFMKMLQGELEEVRYAWPEACDPNHKNIENETICCPLKADKNGRNGNSEDILISEFKDNCRAGNGPNAAPEGGKSDSCQNGNDCCQGGDVDIESIIEKEETMVEIGRRRLETNGVCYINDSLGLHRVANPSHADGAVSLHLYCPPFDACHVFNQQTGRRTKAQVTFWSKYGQRRNREIQDNRAPEDN